VTRSSAAGSLAGTPASPGFAVGLAWRYRTLIGGATIDRSVPQASIEAAAEAASGQLEVLAARLRGGGHPEEAEILEAQALMARDPALITDARRLAAERATVSPAELAAAVGVAAEGLAVRLAEFGDPHLAARAADIRDVGARIGRAILGEGVAAPEPGSIGIADDLPPSVTVDLPDGTLSGIALEGGTLSGHAAILARALGIPAVVGVRGLGAAVDAAVERYGAGSVWVAVDGVAGTVRVGLTDEERAAPAS
jgi:phosphoenolpyruvate-protein phosphotransferase (PTS system enzyme I)